MTDRYADIAAAALRDAASGFDRGVASLGRVASGHYSPGEAAADVGWFADTAATWLAHVVDCGSKLFPPMPPVALTKENVEHLPPIGTVGSPIQAKIHPGVTVRPLSLEPAPFRALGWGEQFLLPQGAFQFSPSAVIPAAVDTFDVTVDETKMPPGSEKYTLIFEGLIVDGATGQVVAGPIRIVKPATSPGP